jgi:hypothetical protein
MSEVEPFLRGTRIAAVVGMRLRSLLSTNGLLLCVALTMPGCDEDDPEPMATSGSTGQGSSAGSSGSSTSTGADPGSETDTETDTDAGTDTESGTDTDPGTDTDDEPHPECVDGAFSFAEVACGSFRIDLDECFDDPKTAEDECDGSAVQACVAEAIGFGQSVSFSEQQGQAGEIIDVTTTFNLTTDRRLQVVAGGDEDLCSFSSVTVYGPADFEGCSDWECYRAALDVAPHVVTCSSDQWCKE